MASRFRSLLFLTVGVATAVLAGLTAYRIAGPYGDGPFGAGYYRVLDPATGQRRLVYAITSSDHAVSVIVDEASHQLGDIRMDLDGDGREDARARVEDGRLIRVAWDEDDDGMSDRWDYYDDERRLVKVGFSLRRDGAPSSWAHYGATGQVRMIEVSTRFDGRVDRWEYYEDGALARVEEDTTGDGLADRWSTYVDGILSRSGIQEAGHR